MTDRTIELTLEKELEGSISGRTRCAFIGLYSFLAVIMLLIISCDNDREIDESIDNTTTGFSKIAFQSNNYDSSYTEFLVPGKRSVITYASYGCFSYSSASLQIEKREDGYFSLNGGPSYKPGKPLLLSPAFSLVLAEFYRYCMRLDRGQAEYSQEAKINQIGVVQKLMIQGGLKNIELTIASSDELTGYTTLMNNIDRYSVKSNTSSQ